MYRWRAFESVLFSQNLPNSAAFTAILKMKLPRCNAIGVRTPLGCLVRKNIESRSKAGSQFPLRPLDFLFPSSLEDFGRPRERAEGRILGDRGEVRD